MRYPFFERRFLYLLFLIFQGCIVQTQKQQGDVVLPYPFAKDSFQVRVNELSGNAQPQDTIHFVYYPDASLKTGKLIESMIATHKQALTDRNYVFVGFAHFGSFRPKRRRDFIIPSVQTSNGYVGESADYGQADSFYHFLSKTIMPLAEQKFSHHVIRRSFIGHSLGGLFATYLLVNGDSLFTNLYALSPALWIDNHHVLDYESSQQGKLNGVTKSIWISCGGNETINRIKNSVERIEDRLEKRKYPGIDYRIKVYKGKTHNSSVEPTLNDIFYEYIHS